MSNTTNERAVHATSASLWLTLYGRLVRVMLSPLVVLAIFIGNGIGAIAGMIYWYGNQLAAAPWTLWIFIPDSPASTFWVLPALALILWRRPGWPFLNAFAAFGVIKYGLWTVLFWLIYWVNGGPAHMESIAMTFTQLVMALEGIVLLGFTRMSRWLVFGLGGWFLLNDLIDYGPLQTRPGLPPGVSVALMMWVALGLTGLITFAYLWIAENGGRLRGTTGGNDDSS